MVQEKTRTTQDCKRKVQVEVTKDELLLVEGENGELLVCTVERFAFDEMSDRLRRALEVLGHDPRWLQLGSWWSYADGTGLSYAPVVLRVKPRGGE